MKTLTPAKELKQLRAELKALRAESRRLAKLPPGPTVMQIICEAAAIAFRGEPPAVTSQLSERELARIAKIATKFDIRATGHTIRPMPAKQPSFATLASVYQVSRQRLHQLAKTYGKPAVLDPSALFFAIHCRQPIIKILSDPVERQRIKEEISKLQS